MHKWNIVKGRCANRNNKGKYRMQNRRGTHYDAGEYGEENF